MATIFPDLIDYIPDHPKLLRQIVKVVRNIMQGRTNNASVLTLTANVATSVITLPTGELGQETLIFFMPQTANAATEFGAGLMYVSSRDVLNSQFTITHANNANADRTFGFILVG